ncbi:MAG TPA: MerR family transcriptional regulator [Amnibacterium sp.]|nr:MerR family transcriptional regulator [Amnibacterium sp.]
MAEVAIGDVARMSGVTARTLRHYEAIGLLLPTSVGSNGYRFYGDAELLRLQRILVLKA